MIRRLLLGLVAAAAASADDPPGQAYNYFPSSRTLAPASVVRTRGAVSDAHRVLSGGPARLSGRGASLTLDFGKDVGGLVTLEWRGASDAAQRVGLAFSESFLYAGDTSDASTGGEGPDGALFAAVTPGGSYTMPLEKLRGGFRYLTLFLDSGGWVELGSVSLAFTAAPTVSVPSAYLNYFYSNDDLLNRVWYASAYTTQLATIDPGQGRVWPPPASGWNNSATIGSGTTLLVDGAKRDRTVWGDMGASIRAAYASTGDLLSARNSLTTFYDRQRSSGELPFSGPAVNLFESDTNHLWTLINTHLYYLFSGDKAWLDAVWPRYKSALAYALAKVGPSGLMRVTAPLDWARHGQGGENIAANALLFRVLVTGAALAGAQAEPELAAMWSTQAGGLRSRINALLWDGAAYRDNPGSTLRPQDGNAFAVLFGVPDPPTRAEAVLTALTSNWNLLGARAPEWDGNISNFPGTFEVHAHFEAAHDQQALDLVRRQWGFMLESPQGTASTFWEALNADGSFAYGGSLMSLAHGWASGPTSALTFYVLGIQPETEKGRAWRVVPHPGDLTHVEGRLALDGDRGVSVSYDRVGCSSFTIAVDASSYPGSTGTLGLPRFGQSHAISVDGALAWDGHSFLGASGIASADEDDGYVYFRGVNAGRRTFRWSDGSCALPSVAAGDAVVETGRSGRATATFSVSLAATGSQPVSVDYATSDGTALAGRDYTATAGRLTFPPGTTETVASVAVPVVGASETVSRRFALVLGAASGALVTRPVGVGTIVSHELPGLAVEDRQVAEGAAANASFRVVLSAPSAELVSVAYATVAGSAREGEDYLGVSGVLAFTPGRTAHSIAVPVVTDGAAEGTEEFTLRLSAPTNAVLVRSDAVGRIMDPPSAQHVPMYRSYSKTNDYHFFTTDLASKNFAVNILGFQDESNPPPFYVLNVKESGSIPLYRMYNPNLGRHFYTASSSSRDFLIGIGAIYEKDEGFVYPLGTSPQPPGTTELFLLYNNNSGTHLFTADTTQKNGILGLFPGIWVQHTSVGLVFTSP